MRVRSIVSWARRPVYMLKGKEKKSGERLNTLILGRNRTVAYFSDLIYSGEPSRTELGKSFVWKARSKARTIQPEPDLILIEMDRFYAANLERQGFTLLPQWILFHLDISKPMPELMKTIKNESLNNNLRKMRKYNYTYEITRDPDKFDLFYYQMYIPHAAMRFGKSSWVFSHRELRQLFEKGRLLLVYLDNEARAGALLLEKEKSLFSHSLGVRGGNIKYVEQGVVTASYLFTIQWANEKGYEWIDFGYCRPFLRDGVFIYKKRWGMAVKNISRSMSLGVFGLKIGHFTKSVHSFLAENPFVFIDRDKLKGLIFAEQNQPLTSKAVRLLMRIHHINGLDNMIIVAPHGFTQEAREMAKAQYPQLLRLMSMDVDVFFKGLSSPANREFNVMTDITAKEDAG